jgi:hypothetical protein
MVRNFTTALVAALVLGSAGIASARGLGNDCRFRTEHGAFRQVDLSAERGAVLLSAELALRTTNTGRIKLTH